jgi:glycosyltransferase involved in cell wall biosynthesis
MNRPIKLLLMVFNQTGKGTYWRAFHWGRVLARWGHDVTLMATSPEARFFFGLSQRSGLRLVETPDLLSGTLRSGWDPWNTMKRIAWLGREDFDLVHAFEARPVALFPALYEKKRGAALIMDWCDWFGRGGSVEERPQPLVRWLLRPIETHFEEAYRRRADGTTVINALLREKAIGLGVDPATILIIQNGSDPGRPQQSREEAKTKVGLEGEDQLIGFVGGTFLQDARFMAKAFNRVVARNKKVKLLLIGYFNREIEGWLSDPSRVVRTGSLPYNRLFDYLSACDICWLPLCDNSANQGRRPLKLNDYLTVGRPVVATDVGDLRAVIEKYRLGLIADTHFADFAQKTLELLEQTPLREEMGRKARVAAETVFSWDRITKDLERFYFGVLAKASLN